MSKELIQELLSKYKDGTLTKHERSQLTSLLHSVDNRAQLEKAIEEEISSTGDKGDSETMELIYQQILYAKDGMNDEGGKLRSISPRYVSPKFASRRSSRRTFRRLAVAASIIFIIAIGAIVIARRGTTKQSPEIVNNQPGDVEAPKTIRAMITLADGRTISIDSLTTLDQSNIVITKTADGKIVYQSTASSQQSAIQYNTLSNPRGSKVIDMTLADGSRVWLNAGSSVTYPVAFIGNERKVNITGEAYFEISHIARPFKAGTDDKKTRGFNPTGHDKWPFIVSANNKADVTVLGTHFNVNAYDDEADIKVTLLEGSITVSSQRLSVSAVKIMPGQQAQISSAIKVSENVDLEEVIAWKNGKFQFNDASIETIMKDISRWYDAEIVYDGKIPGNFVADIARDVPVSKLLHILELTNRVHFKIDGKKITVMK